MNPNMIVFKQWGAWFFSERKWARDSFKIGFWSTFISIILFIALLWLYYVWTLNLNSTKGFTIRKLDSEKTALNIEKELLSVMVADKQSLNNIMSSDIVKEMEKIDAFEYIVLENNKTFVYQN